MTCQLTDDELVILKIHYESWVNLKASEIAVMQKKLSPDKGYEIYQKHIRLVGHGANPAEKFIRWETIIIDATDCLDQIKDS